MTEWDLAIVIDDRLLLEVLLGAVGEWYLVVDWCWYTAGKLGR